jgi:hypothetical protein
MAMLSDKLPDRKCVIPPQIRPPRDPLKVYSFVGGVLGIIVVFVIRNWLRVPHVMLPPVVVFHVGGHALSFGLQDVVLGAIGGSTIGVYFGRKAREKEDSKRYRARHPEIQEKRS